MTAKTKQNLKVWLFSGAGSVLVIGGIYGFGGILIRGAIDYAKEDIIIPVIKEHAPSKNQIDGLEKAIRESAIAQDAASKTQVALSETIARYITEQEVANDIMEHKLSDRPTHEEVKKEYTAASVFNSAMNEFKSNINGRLNSHNLHEDIHTPKDYFPSVESVEVIERILKQDIKHLENDLMDLEDEFGYLEEKIERALQ